MIDKLLTLDAKASTIVAGVIAFFVLILWFPVGLYRAPSSNISQAADRELSSYREALRELSPVITNRPVFDRSRRPVQAPEAPVVAPVTLQLVGVLTDGRERIALVRLSNSPTLYRLKDGDTLLDWTVRRINEQDIVIKKRGESAQTIGIAN
ncbi:MAG: hypothetical protein AAFR98_07390 [Pseudomonadota bacterium]